MTARKREQKARMARDRERNSTAGAMTSSDSPYLVAGIERYGRVASRRGIEPRHPDGDRHANGDCHTDRNCDSAVH
jgi:hypothetical protein